ncbi:hypothetical protein ACP4OV_023062 [Aristida adscensionis]
MQGGKSTSAVEAAKEAAANVGASAWAGKEKTKAVVQETAAKLRAHEPADKAAADARLHDRVRGAEAAKQEAMRHNAAAKDRANAAAEHHPTTASASETETTAPGPGHGGVPVAALGTGAAARANAAAAHHPATAAATGSYDGAPVAPLGTGASARGGGYPPASGTAAGR